MGVGVSVLGVGVSVLGGVGVSAFSFFAVLRFSPLMLFSAFSSLTIRLSKSVLLSVTIGIGSACFSGCVVVGFSTSDDFSVMFSHQIHYSRMHEFIRLPAFPSAIIPNLLFFLAGEVTLMVRHV